jgi:hypothetical protein
MILSDEHVTSKGQLSPRVLDEGCYTVLGHVFRVLADGSIVYAVAKAWFDAQAARTGSVGGLDTVNVSITQV